jgi:hypothetical protein
VSGQRLRVGIVPRLRLPCALACPIAVVGEWQEGVKTHGMDAPTLNGIDVPKWKCQPPLKRMGASVMKITTVGIDLAKNVFVRPASRLSFCFTGEVMA